MFFSFQVQVIQSPFIPSSLNQQAYIQQQLMLQNAAVQAAMQAHAINNPQGHALNPQMNLAVQGRQAGVGTSPKSPAGIISPQAVTSPVSVDFY